MRGCVTARLLPLNTSRLRQKGGNGLLELIFKASWSGLWACDGVLGVFLFGASGHYESDFAYLETHVPIINDLMQVLLAVGWALLIGKSWCSRP